MIPPMSSSSALLIGLVAFLCGLLACVSAVFGASQERRLLARLPVHQVKIEVEGLPARSLSIRSNAATPQELADRIALALSRAL